ncbi:hypothetical protein DUNSADRAFT_14872 [Dunaliella salina]|uniref:Peptidase S8/S53 domain-containing protein n=1 Tax=Dunaliella salina TaxID=3046 RepID=A0ABQ7G6N9_DUNSA|nr:hypothetical protein DUNSADRAFT_14872 [Dunaliella salina]|eukprot:KAF5830230.1 hypothetical protein DUNSADRAFT_14872 [Dunaliella salina]
MSDPMSTSATQIIERLYLTSGSQTNMMMMMVMGHTVLEPSPVPRLAQTQLDRQTWERVAPLAKLTFFDNSIGLYRKDVIFSLHFQEGARIASASWGAVYSTGLSGYTNDCEEVDGFVWSNDILILAAAGNDGAVFEEEGVMYGSTTYPAGSCKNVVSVGNAMNWEADDVPDLYDASGSQVQLSDSQMASIYDTNREIFVYREAPSGINANVAIMTFDFNVFAWGRPEKFGPRQKRELVLADPLDACQTLVGDYSRKMVLFMQSDSCDLQTAATNVQNASPYGGMYVNIEGSLNVFGTSDYWEIPFVTTSGDSNWGVPCLSAEEEGETCFTTLRDYVLKPEAHMTFHATLFPREDHRISIWMSHQALGQQQQKRKIFACMYTSLPLAHCSVQTQMGSTLMMVRVIMV